GPRGHEQRIAPTPAGLTRQVVAPGAVVLKLQRYLRRVGENCIEVRTQGSQHRGIVGVVVCPQVRLPDHLVICMKRTIPWLPLLCRPALHEGVDEARLARPGCEIGQANEERTLYPTSRVPGSRIDIGWIARAALELR